MNSPQSVFLAVAKPHNSYDPTFAGVTLLVIGAYYESHSYRLDGVPTSMDPFYYIRNVRHTFYDLHWEIKELPPL